MLHFPTNCFLAEKFRLTVYFDFLQSSSLWQWIYLILPFGPAFHAESLIITQVYWSLEVGKALKCYCYLEQYPLKIMTEVESIVTAKLKDAGSTSLHCFFTCS